MRYNAAHTHTHTRDQEIRETRTREGVEDDGKVDRRPDKDIDV